MVEVLGEVRHGPALGGFAAFNALGRIGAAVRRRRAQERAVEVRDLRVVSGPGISPPPGFVRHDELLTKIVNNLIIMQTSRRAKGNRGRSERE